MTGDFLMMNESEVQLAIYVESVLRMRGYAEVANNLNSVIGAEVERRARVFAPANMQWRPTG